MVLGELFFALLVWSGGATGWSSPRCFAGPLCSPTCGIIGNSEQSLEFDGQFSSPALFTICPCTVVLAQQAEAGAGHSKRGLRAAEDGTAAGRGGY